MLRNIAKWVVAILLFMAGWTVGQLLESLSYFELDNAISVSELVGVGVDCMLAVWIVRAVGKKDQENRIEKDFFIQEYDKIQDAINILDRECATQNVLSFDVTTYNIARCRKIIVRLWKEIGDIHPGFKKKYQSKQDAFMLSIKGLDTKLTDTKYYCDKQGINPLKIVNGKIYLNGTIKPAIDDEITEIKKEILEMKLLVNKI